MSSGASDVEKYLAELKSSVFLKDSHTPESFEYMVAYYRDRSRRKRYWFRATSVAIILLGGLLPLLAAFASDFTVQGIPISKNFLVASFSAAIAILTGITTHFRWEVGWRSQTEALFVLQGLRAEWEAAIARARASSAIDRVDELAITFDRFHSRTFEVVHAEMGDFFKVQQPPVKSVTPV